MKIKVPDMTCGGCSAAVERALHQVDPQATVTVDLANKVIDIDSGAPAEHLLEAISDAGFTPTLQD